MIADYVTYDDVANMLFCSKRTACRRVARMREVLNLPRGSKITPEQIRNFFHLP